MLKEALPLYDTSSSLIEREMKSVDHGESAQSSAKQELLDNLPLSGQEFEAAWLDLCAFETGGHAWIPSAVNCFGVWKSIMSAAHQENADLVKGFSPSIIKQTITEQDTYPEELLDAVIQRVCNDPSNILDCGTAHFSSSKYSTADWEKHLH